MELKVETLPGYRIAYVRQVGPYGPANTRPMEKLKQWAAENNLLAESAILFGIPQDNPETTPPENCRYDACIVLTEDDKIDDAIAEGELAGGRYAVATINHTADDVQQAWAAIFPALQSGGYQLDDRPILERYAGDMLNKGLCELCIPIKAL